MSEQSADQSSQRAPDLDEIDCGPPRASLEDGEPCPACGYTFDSDEWGEQHYHGGAWAGESWGHTCPNCEQETCVIST